MIQNSTIAINDSCPCCSGENFGLCCKMIIDDISLATSPIQIMRSRFTAYVIRNENHLLRSWYIQTRPETISFPHDSIWLDLRILNHSVDTATNEKGTVSYIARFIEDGKLISLTENSNFILSNGKWYYVDGEVEIQKDNLSLKSLCPCNSKKKYKHCCFKK